ncbi:MAG: tryptophan 2,3-dioxygenase [Sandaracinaceae bacterium]|jgi:tryptophan 2,3-dioxygenase|nr:tryptophan 2,3-dioxygenase [Sandaracinaceae bacterium]
MTSEAKPVSEYEIYLGVPTLLSLQKEGGARAHRDELLFQVIHQVEELWMKLAINEINDAVGHLNADEVASALGLLRRVTEIERMMIGQLRLIEMMSPHSYIAVRKVLGQGSGQESPGFNAMLRVAPELGAAMHGVLKRACVSALEVHAEPTKHPLLFQLTECVIDYDELFQTFRFHHIMLVKRIIGAGTASLKGKPTELLERSMRAPFYPELWEVRETMFADFSRGENLYKK